MATDIVSATPWSPPEAKRMAKYIKWATMGALALGGVFAFLWVGPIALAALVLLNLILESLLHAGIAFVGCMLMLWAIHSAFSSEGSIHHMLLLPWQSFVNGMTRFWITLDPLSSINARIDSVRADQASFEKQFETLDGAISSLHNKATNYRNESLKAQRLGIAATRQGAAGAAEVASHKFGSYKEAADSYEAAIARLEPARATFQQISQAADVTAQKLETERTLLKDKWDTQKLINSAVGSASRILGRTKTQVWADAEQASSIIDTKYGEELGHLDHLKRYTEPFVQSINVENASYSEEMLQQVQTVGTKLITSTAATPSPVAALPGAVGSEALSGFIR